MKVSMKALRVNANLDQKQAAKMIGVSNNTLINWEKYKSFPDAMQMNKMCNVYQCTLDDFYLPDSRTEREHFEDIKNMK